MGPMSISVGLALVAGAAAPPAVPNPYYVEPAPVVIDLSPGAARPPAQEESPARFEDLDAYMGRPVETHPQGALPEGWVQRGGVVIPRAVAEGADVFTPVPREGPDNLVEGPDAAELCSFPEATPAGIYPGKFRRGSEYPRRGTIYMNFTGGVLVNGNGENSAENYSALAKTGAKYPVYTGGEERAIAVAQAVQADFADWGIRVAYTKRPRKTAPYVMIMMGGHHSDTLAGPSGGVAPGADCEDIGMRNVCYAFVNDDAVTVQSNIASQEIGHTMGLGHTYGGDRVMAFGYNAFGSEDMGFGDECTEALLVAEQSGACTGVNKCHCADGFAQHDKRTLTAIYAPPGPDEVPPEIAITLPEDGAVFQKGETIAVHVDPWDNFGGYGWKLVIERDGEALADVVDYAQAMEFALGGLPPGVYTLIAEVEDQSDNIAQDRITITVEGEAAPTTGEVETDGDLSSSGGEDEGGESSSSGGEGDDAGATSGGSQDDADEGCGCRSDAEPSALALSGLGLLALRRRRRA